MAGARAFLLLCGLLLGTVVRGDVACSGEDKRVPDVFVNDGYCDCEAEGTDEPATGACGTASFRCENRPHSSLQIPASRVNDGVCDCCDGSDEFLGHAQCQQTCEEAAARAREAGKRELQLLESGMKIREQRVVDGMAAKAARAVELSSVRDKLLALEKEIEEATALKAAEEKLEEEESGAVKADAAERALPEAMGLRQLGQADAMTLLVRAILRTKETSTVEEVLKVIGAEPLDGCEVDDADAIAAAIEHKEAGELPAIPPPGLAENEAAAAVDIPLFDGCSVDVFNAVYEPPDGIGGAPTSAAGLGVGAHPLAERGIVAKAVRVSPGCEATLHQSAEQDGAVTDVVEGDTILTEAWNPAAIHVRAKPLGCVSWRQTAGCTADGAHEASNDRACDATVDSGISGYCECTGGFRTAKSACDARGAFTCKDKCAAIRPVEERELAAIKAAAQADSAAKRAEAIEKRAVMEAATAERVAKVGKALCAHALSAESVHAVVIKMGAKIGVDHLLAEMHAIVDQVNPASVRDDDARAAMKVITDPHKRAGAEAARTALADLNKAKADSERAQSATEKLARLERDFGAEQEYFPLYSQEISKRIGQYEYKVRSFENVKQDWHDLGSYKGWKDGVVGGTMHFGGGSSCGGKSREAWVALACGPSDEVLDAREDEMCVYVLTMQSPSACKPQRMAEIRRELGHAEL